MSNRMNDNQLIAESTADLLALLDELVPRSTIHYAVEEARTALRTLNRFAKEGTIQTKDKA